VNSELTDDFIKYFGELPERVKIIARKNYQLWKQNPHHPSLDFKKIQKNKKIYSVRIGMGWRALGTMKNQNSIVWFWIGSHHEYDLMLKSI
jgi:mRNA-degrading endonuclease RelE of RelBE toxin-antitoxin system